MLPRSLDDYVNSTTDPIILVVTFDFGFFFRAVLCCIVIFIYIRILILLDPSIQVLCIDLFDPMITKLIKFIILLNLFVE